MKLGWQRAGPSSDDAQCVGTSTISSICDTRGLWANGEPARHLINSRTSSAWDTYQLLVAVGHRCNDKPLNSASRLNNHTKWGWMFWKKDLLVYFSFLYWGSEAQKPKIAKNVLLFFTSGPPYFYDAVVNIYQLQIRSYWLHRYTSFTYHSLPPHLFERRAHLLPLCSGMNNICIIKPLALIYSPPN